jgi:hypothetical protein
MKDKYSDIVFASVASSAPVEAQFNFYQYFDPIIRYGSQPCINSIQKVVSTIDDILFGSDTKQVNTLKALFDAEDLYDDDFASRKYTSLYDIKITNFFFSLVKPFS